MDFCGTAYVESGQPGSEEVTLSLKMRNQFKIDWGDSRCKGPEVAGWTLPRTEGRTGTQWFRREG